MKPAIIFLLCFAVCRTTAAEVTSPDVYLGRALGADFTLADWNETSGYYRRLAEESPNVLLESAGKTTEGRDFLVATISSEENLKRLVGLKAHARVLADPRGKSPERKIQALSDGKVFLVITPSMHSTEVAGTQFGMEFAWLLATSDEEPWRSARENIVVFITPTLNPDGLDHVVDWYRRTVKTPYEGSNLPRLYQQYAGHDNNRDWFMLSQVETRILSRLLYHEWRPQILWDVHQQGQSEERLFVPPYRDPLNPNIDPAIVASINLIGTRAVFDLTRQGFTGVATGSTYDMWWHGGNRSTPARHNIVGILTEAASANLASPIFLSPGSLKPPVGEQYVASTSFVNPWRGGWWRVRDIINYELAFGRSLLSTINRDPRLWRQNALEAAERAVRPGREGVQGWIIPADNRDPSAVRRLVDSLLLSGVEIHVSDSPVSANGRTYPAGSILIRRDQPSGAHVKDLFEIQRYPGTRAPYDIAGWTLPLVMGVHRVEVMHPREFPARIVQNVDEALLAFAGSPATSPGAISTASSGSWTEVTRRLAAGEALRFLTRGDHPGEFISADEQTSAAHLELKRLPRIGIYAPWLPNMDEGWLRWVFDDWRIPYVSVRNEALRAGELLKGLDVLIIADASAAQIQSGRPPGTVPEEFSGGLAPEGTAAIEEFVRAGGALITFKNASKWAARLLRLPLIDTTSTDEAKGFSCPGSVLRGIPAADQPLTAGLPLSVPVFFAGGAAWKEMTKAEREKANLPETTIQPLLRYAPTELLLSGYIAKSGALEGQIAWLRAEYGRGRAHLFGFQPHYRGWAQATIPLIFRAALLEPPPNSNR